MKKWSELVSALQGGQIALGQLGLHKVEKFGLKRGSRIFTIGSCFARNIEDRLEESGFDFPVKAYSAQPGEFSGPRPRGILNKFTPSCMLQDLLWVQAVDAGGGSFATETRNRFYFGVGDGQVVDLGLQEYQPVTEARFWQRREDILRIYRALYEADAVILTLGLIEQWYFRGQPVQHAPSNRAMLKQRADFSFTSLSDAEVKQTLVRMVETLRSINPAIKIIFTVSPVPLKSTFSEQHVYVANQLSKSRLLVGAHAMLDVPNVDYFPSYEVVQLVGSAAFEPDLRHVKDGVVKAICQYFGQVYMAIETKSGAKGEVS